MPETKTPAPAPTGNGLKDAFSTSDYTMGAGSGNHGIITPKKHQNPVCGFPLSVFRRQGVSNPNHAGGCKGSDKEQKERLFLISNTSNTPHKQHIGGRVKTKNRKYVSHSDTFLHNGTTYQINSKISGIYTRILGQTLDQLEICKQKWGRVFVLRFDLHQRYYSQDNKRVSRFIDNIKRRLEREYGIHELGYVWVREQQRSKAQHYHVAIMLDGNQIRHSSKVLRIIKDTWNRRNGNHLPTIPKPYYFIDSTEVMEQAVYRLSYLAKARGKGYRDKQAKDYSTSRLA